MRENGDTPQNTRRVPTSRQMPGIAYKMTIDSTKMMLIGEWTGFHQSIISMVLESVKGNTDQRGDRIHGVVIPIRASTIQFQMTPDNDRDISLAHRSTKDHQHNTVTMIPLHVITTAGTATAVVRCPQFLLYEEAPLVHYNTLISTKRRKTSRNGQSRTGQMCRILSSGGHNNSSRQILSVPSRLALIEAEATAVTI
ncbi:MAG: hypothetical protein M1825_002115 [Sarcosagium campestre]|nr:MAG: hypothetical protein M1825_002115 [Sarcosagium campestre]